jgi:transcriptional regulator GlxA family with amidase domain
LVERRIFSGTNRGKNLRYLDDVVIKDLPSLKVGFLLLEHFSLPSFTQALDTLVTANLIRSNLFESSTFSIDGKEVVSDLGIVIKPDNILASSSLDACALFVVCGGLRTPLRESPTLKALLLKAADRGIALGGLWSGAWFLATAGLLDAYQCAIHPEHRLALAEAAPLSSVTSESHVVDRNRYTAASPHGAFHMILDWVGRSHGAVLVEGISGLLAFEASRYRRSNATQRPNMTVPLREVVKLMETNLEEPLELDQIALYVAKSRRQIERMFNTQLNTTPSKYYLELRVTEGRRLLQHSTLSIVQVAVTCGFVSPSHFSKCYTAYFGHSPSKELRLEV